MSVNLDAISVRSPCELPWAAMRGDDRTRFCGHCRQRVFNLSEMTREEAEELVSRKTGRLCVRFYRRADGTVVTRNCRGLVGTFRRRLAAGVTIMLGLTATMFGWLVWTNRSESVDRYDNW